MNMSSCLTLANLPRWAQAWKKAACWCLRNCCRTSRWSVRVPNLFCVTVCVSVCTSTLHFLTCCAWKWRFIFLTTSSVHGHFCDPLCYSIWTWQNQEWTRGGCRDPFVSQFPLHKAKTFSLPRLWIGIQVIALAMGLVRGLSTQSPF